MIAKAFLLLFILGVVAINEKDKGLTLEPLGKADMLQRHADYAEKLVLEELKAEEDCVECEEAKIALEKKLMVDEQVAENFKNMAAQAKVNAENAIKKLIIEQNVKNDDLFKIWKNAEQTFLDHLRTLDGLKEDVVQKVTTGVTSKKILADARDAVVEEVKAAKKSYEDLDAAKEDYLSWLQQSLIEAQNPFDAYSRSLIEKENLVYSANKGITNAKQLYEAAYSISNKYPFNDNLKMKAADSKAGLDNAVSNFENAQQDYYDNALILVEASNQLIKQSNKITADIQYVSNEVQRISDESRQSLVSTLHEADKSLNLVKAATTASKDVKDAVDKLKNAQVSADNAQKNVDQIKDKIVSSTKALNILRDASKAVKKVNDINLNKLQSKIDKINNEIDRDSYNLDQLKREYNRAKANAAVSNSALVTSKSDDLLMAESNRDEICARDDTSDACKDAQSNVEKLTPDSLKLLIQVSQKAQDAVDISKQKVSDAQNQIDNTKNELQYAKLEKLNNSGNLIESYVDEVSNELVSLQAALDTANENLNATQDDLKNYLNSLRSITPSGIATSDLVNQISMDEIICDSLVSELASQAVSLENQIKASNDEINVLIPQLKASKNALTILTDSGADDSKIQEAQDAIKSISNLIYKGNEDLNLFEDALNKVTVELATVLPPAVKVEDFMNNLVSFYQTINDKDVINFVKQLRNTQETLNQQKEVLLKITNGASNDMNAIDRLSDQLGSAQDKVKGNMALLNAVKPEDLIDAENKVVKLENEISNSCEGLNNSDNCGLLQKQLIDAKELVRAKTPASFGEVQAAMDDDQRLVVDLAQKLKDTEESSHKSLNDLKSAQNDIDKTTQSLNDIIISILNIIPPSLDAGFVVNYVNSGSDFLSDEFFSACSDVSFPPDLFADGRSDNFVNDINSKVTDLYTYLFGLLSANTVNVNAVSNTVTDGSGVLSSGVSSTLSSLLDQAASMVSEANDKVLVAQAKVNDLQSLAEANPSCLSCIDDVNNAKEDLAVLRNQLDNASEHLNTVQNASSAPDTNIAQLSSCKKMVLSDISSAIISVHGFKQLFLTESTPSSEDISFFLSSLREQANHIKQGATDLDCPGACSVVSVDPIVAIVANLVIQAQSDVDTAKSNSDSLRSQIDNSALVIDSIKDEIVEAQASGNNDVISSLNNQLNVAIHNNDALVSSMNVSLVILSSAQRSLDDANDKLASVIPNNVDISKVLNSVIALAPEIKICNIQSLASVVASGSVELHQAYSDKMGTLALIASLERKLLSDPKVIALTNKAVVAQIALNFAKSVLSSAQDALKDTESVSISNQNAVDDAKAGVKDAEAQMHLAFKDLLASMPVGATYQDAVDATDAEIEFRALKTKYKSFIISESDKSLNELKLELVSINNKIFSLSSDLAINQSVFDNCAHDLGMPGSDVRILKATSDPVVSKLVVEIQRKTDLLNQKGSMLNKLKSDKDYLDNVITSLTENLESSKSISSKDDNATVDALNIANNRLSELNDKISIAIFNNATASAQLESAKFELGSALPSDVSIEDVVSAVAINPSPLSVFSSPPVSTGDLVNDISNSQQNLDASAAVTDNVNSQISSLLQAIQEAQIAVSNSDSADDAVADLKEKQDGLSQLQDSLHDAIQSQQAAKAKLDAAVSNFGSSFPSGVSLSDPHLCHLVDEIVQSKSSLDSADMTIHVAEKDLINASAGGIDVENRQQAYNNAVASRRYIEANEHHLLNLVESVVPAGSKFEDIVTVCNSLSQLVSDPSIVDLITKSQQSQDFVFQAQENFNKLSDNASYSSNVVKKLQEQSNSVLMTNQVIIDDAKDAKDAYFKILDEVQAQKDKAQEIISAAKENLDDTKSYFQKSFPSGVPATNSILCSAVDQFRQSKVELDNQNLVIHLALRELYNAQQSGAGILHAQAAVDAAKENLKDIEIANHHLLEVLTMLNPNINFKDASSLCESVSSVAEDPVIVELVATFQKNQNEVTQYQKFFDNISDTEINKLKKASELAEADAVVAQQAIDKTEDQLNTAISQSKQDYLAKNAAKDDLIVLSQNLSDAISQVQAAVPDNVDVSHVAAVISSVTNALSDPKVLEIVKNVHDLQSDVNQVIIESQKATDDIKDAEKRLDTLQQELEKLKGDAKDAGAEIEGKRTELENAVYSGAKTEEIFAIQDEIEKKSAMHDKIQTMIIEKAQKSVAASKAVEEVKSAAHDIFVKQVKLQSELKDSEKSLKYILPGPVSISTILAAPPRLSCPNDCNGNGFCSISGICTCNEEFGGNDCSLVHYVCPGKIDDNVFCNGNGKCSFSGECDCYDGYRGADCAFKQTPCPGQIGVSFCSGHGQCSFSGICDCDESYRGSDCRIAVGVDAVNVDAAVNSLTEQFNNALAASNMAATGGDGTHGEDIFPDLPLPSVGATVIDQETKVEDIEKIFTSMCNSIPELLKRKHDAEIHIHRANGQIENKEENDFVSNSKHLQVYKQADQIYQFALQGCNSFCEHLPEILKKKEEAETHIHIAHDQLSQNIENDLFSNPRYLDNYNEAVRVYELASTSCSVLQVPTSAKSIFDTYPLPTTKEPFINPYPFVVNTIAPLTEPTVEPTVVFKLVLPTDVPYQPIINDSLLKDIKSAIDNGLSISSVPAISKEDAKSRTEQLDQIVTLICSSLPELMRRKEEAEIHIHKANNENQNGVKNDFISNSKYLEVYKEAAQFYDIATRNCDLLKGHLEGSKQDLLNLSSPQSKYLK